MNSLDGKKILFIGPKYFGYERKIINMIKSFGANVDFIQENLKHDNYFYHLISKVPKKLNKQLFDTYFINKIDNFKKKKYDYIFLIRGELISEKVLSRLKALHHDAKFIMYQWDSIDNVPNAKKLFKYFDVIYTFDQKDYLNYREVINIQYRPLFFIEDYVIKKKKDYEIDILFIGSYHSDRYDLLKKLKKIFKKENLNFYVYLYIKKPLYIKKKYFSYELKMSQKEDFKFEPISTNEIISFFKKSKTILDIQNPSQTGLTMRTIETLGANRKLITTNNLILEHDFYNGNNISVIDRQNIEFNCNFIRKKHKEIPDHIYQKYSLNYWIKEIFDLTY
jgi:hypothetical protein